MPSRPIDTGWAFDAVIDLIESDLDGGSPTLSTASTLKSNQDAQELGDDSVPQPPLDTPYNPRLGDFTKLFGELGISLPGPAEPIGHLDSDGLISSDAVTLNDQSSSPCEHEDSDGLLAELTAKQHKKARKKAAKRERKARRALEASAVPADLSDTQEPATPPRTRSNVGAKIRPATPKLLETQPDASALYPHRKIHQYIYDRTKSVSVHTPVQNINSPAEAAPPFTPPSGQWSQSTINASLPQVPFSFRLNHGLVPRTVQPANAPRIQTLSSVQPYGKPILQPSTTPLYEPNTPWHNVSGKAYAPPRQVQPHLAQTPYKIFSPNRFSTPVQISATPSGPFRGLTIRPQTDKHFHFFNQLLANFPADAPGLLSPMSLTNQERRAHGIHCFVDASNIMIGFRDMLRKYGQHHLEMSFDTLALLMERRRPVAKRIYAGSHREAAPLPHVTKLVETSKAVGYENLVKEQVFIRRDDSERKKFFKNVERMGWTKATQLRSGLGSGSDSETGQAASAIPSNPKWVEQGVDEILHLKMCQSIIDTEVPTTMVLATGDGNAAEFSDGFLANVERALKNGWTVELVSWKQQMSAGYRNKKFRAKWGDKFKVIELDDYLESLIDTECM